MQSKKTSASKWYAILYPFSHPHPHVAAFVQLQAALLFQNYISYFDFVFDVNQTNEIKRLENSRPFGTSGMHTFQAYTP